MSNYCRFLFVLIGTASLMCGCAKKADPSAQFPDPSVQNALLHVQELNTLSERDLEFSDYGTRVQSAKTEIDDLLSNANDRPAAEKVRLAFSHHLAAYQAWNQSISMGGGQPDLSPHWALARQTSDFAAQYVTTVPARRANLEAWEEKRQKEEHELAMAEAAEALRVGRELQAKHAEEMRLAEEKKRQKEEEAAAEARKEQENMQVRQELEQKMAEADRQLERSKHVAPPGKVYNVETISFPIRNGLHGVTPGTELTFVRKNQNGTVRVRYLEYETDVSPYSVTVDRDIADTAKENDSKAQAAIREWQQQQAKLANDSKEQQRLEAEAKEAERRAANDSATQGTDSPRTNPLDLPAY